MLILILRERLIKLFKYHTPRETYTIQVSYSERDLLNYSSLILRERLIILFKYINMSD